MTGLTCWIFLTIPSKENIKATFLQIAHKEPIQKPKYALDKILDVSRDTVFLKWIRDMEKMYVEKKANCKKCFETFVLQVSPSTQGLKYLQHFRGLDDVSLQKMLRFMTGSDVMCVEHVRITFTSIEGLSKWPHTCGPLLELSSKYQAYPEIRGKWRLYWQAKNVSQWTLFNAWYISSLKIGPLCDFTACIFLSAGCTLKQI